MKLLAIADTHLGFTSGRTAESRKLVSDSIYQSFSNVLGIAQKEGYDFILHAGDVFNRSSPKKYEVKRTFSSIENLVDEGIGFVMVPGNHDRAHLPDSLLRYFYKNYYCFNKLSSFDIGEISIIGFPFEYDSPKSKFEQALELAQRHKGKDHIILCHQLFRGASFGPHNFRFMLQSDVINPINLPSNLKLIISGHIHRAQSLFNGVVIYPGSTERTSHIEIIEPKGYVSINIAEEKPIIQFHKLHTMSMKVLEYDISQAQIPYNLIDTELTDNNSRTMIRFYGRKLDTNEIKSFYFRYPSKEWPLLSISPNRPEVLLDALYSNYYQKFDFDQQILQKPKLITSQSIY